MQTPKDTRSIEAKRLDELALQYRTTRDPEVLTEMRALARRLSQVINNPVVGVDAPCSRQLLPYQNPVQIPCEFISQR
jgi:hypothetical protein